MNKPTLIGIAGLILCLVQPCQGVVTLEMRLGGTSDNSVTVAPGATISLDVVATSIGAEAGVLANLDAFTYRVTFPNEDFVLLGSSFTAPFDNARSTDTPPGFNGSIPWSASSVPITDAADAGSPGFTPLTADLYRTTATINGAAVSGPNAVLETLTLRVPEPPAGFIPAAYSIDLNLLEAVDNFGTFHSVGGAGSFLVTVVPEPSTIVSLMGMALVGLGAFRRFFVMR